MNAVDSDSTKQFEKVPPGRCFQSNFLITFGKLIMASECLRGSVIREAPRKFVLVFVQGLAFPAQNLVSLFN